MKMAFIKITAALSLLALASASLEPHYLPPYSGSYTAGAASGFASGSAVHRTVDILGFENVNNGDGSYKYSYNTANGISAHESGSPRAHGPEGAAVTAEGGFSYTAPDGQQISLTYTADENGFHPVGSHLPTPPPIPEAILKSIQFNRQHASSSSQGAYNAQYDNGYHY